MNVLLIGGGGREHAIAWKLRQSPLLTDLHVAPGNAGTEALGHNLDLAMPRTGAPQDEVDAFLARILQTARDLRVDLVFVAPDDPLSWGLVDRLDAAGIAAFGPTKAADALESSKAWAKGFMARHGVPHPRSVTFDDAAAARAYIEAADRQLVVKADGLAAGKGAIVTSTKQEALDAVEELMTQRIAGAAGSRVVIEDRINGREVSPHAFCDGKTVAPMPLSCDHKAVFDGGEGPNTGGMGVYSPPWWTAPGAEDEALSRIVLPTIQGMLAEGTPFKGILYPNLMATESGLQVLEYNARFGDPETQALLPRLKSDLLQICIACVEGRLAEVPVEWEDNASVCVVLASGGYPNSYPTGLPISGIDDVDPDVRVFHAGTRRNDSGFVTAGGRVLSVVATAPALAAARDKAYANVGRIHFEGAHFRRDIALQA
jgi:phosphoribosylamine--glycine ligase